MISGGELADMLGIAHELVYTNQTSDSTVRAIVLCDVSPELMREAVYRARELGCTNFLANVVDVRFADRVTAAFQSGGFAAALERSWDYVVATVRG